MTDKELLIFIELLNKHKITEAKKQAYNYLKRVNKLQLKNLIFSVIDRDSKSFFGTYDFSKRLLNNLSEENILKYAEYTYKIVKRIIDKKNFVRLNKWSDLVLLLNDMELIGLTEEELDVVKQANIHYECSDIMRLVKNGMYDDANQKIIEYLEKENLSEYIDIAKALMKVSYFENNYYHITNFLNQTILGKIEINSNYYWEEMNKCINYNNYHQAYKWFKILKAISIFDVNIFSTQEVNNIYLYELRYNIIYYLRCNNRTKAYNILLEEYLPKNNQLYCYSLGQKILSVSYSKNNFKYIKDFLFKFSIDNLIAWSNRYMEEFEIAIQNKDSKSAFYWSKVIYELIDIGCLNITKEEIEEKYYRTFETNNFILNDSSIRNINTFDFDIFSVEKIPDYVYEGLNYFNNTKESIKEICLKLDLNEEEQLIYQVYLAQEFYKNGFDNCGDKLLKQVSRSEDKTALVKKLVEDSKKHKQLYKKEEKILILKRTI